MRFKNQKKSPIKWESPSKHSHPTRHSQERIVTNSAILAGKPIVRGTRLAVEFVIDLLAKGWTSADILENYPQLELDDIQACLAYAGNLLSLEKLYPLNLKQ